MKIDVISKVSDHPKFPTPLLFVHGLWVGMWGWQEHFLDYFYAQGFNVHAFSLQGHGKSPSSKPLWRVRLKDFVEDLDCVVKQLPTPPILIGHSNGGMIVQRYLEQHHHIPAAVLLASIPPQGIWRAALLGALKFPIPFIKANLTLKLLPLVATPTMARFQFFSDAMSQADVERFQKQMSDESFLEFLDVLCLNLPKPKKVTTPMLVMGGEKDTAFPPYLVESTARAYHTTAKIFPGMAHGMMLEPGWQDVAQAVVDWIQTMDSNQVIQEKISTLK